MLPFSIRSFRRNDTNDVVELWKLCGLIVPQNDPFKDICRKEEEKPNWFLIGEVEGKIIASCMIGYDGHRGCINYLAVHPDHQRKGYGEEIMRAAERVLIEAGCPKINLLVRVSNQSVVSFYQKIGYADNDCLSLGKRLIADEEP